MSLQVIRKITFWPKTSSKSESNSSEVDWIGDAMRVANLTIAAGPNIPDLLRLFHSQGLINSEAQGTFARLCRMAYECGGPRYQNIAGFRDSNKE
ncbi:hypothetical protein M422DRAFT_248181 [Sphaerobolus stellatus SS14]|uniref:Uncharacterized protein n=1 Tax=Sphaerobolus stellatus (strain SS14) TaxID=990650 RepID=A0A0C9VW92_SPHS4|nr:hypothetical protein M422DRAFT_248181 [Sphaerobolus stellatus SS14]